MLIEANVDNRDIGFVHAGQAVAVKVQTFEFTRYGLLHGHVVDVSRDSTADDGASSRPDDRGTGSSDGQDDKGSSDAKMPGYVAHIALEGTTLRVDGKQVTVTPGMAVTAEIKTGRRSVISYLLSPLRRYAHEGMTER